MHLVFVYGSLKSNNGLNYMLHHSPFLGKATTDKDYTLLDGPSFPFLVERPSRNGARGELYQVDDITLKILDQVEGHPNFYERKTIVVIPDKGPRVEVYAYIHPDNEHVKNLNTCWDW